MVYKHAPYTPAAAGFDANDAQWLADNGFDSVRLGILWKAVEPNPGVYDDAYLDSIRQTVRELSSRGILVLIDAHQDMYNEKFQGEFAPDWAVIDDGLPSEIKAGFPTNQAVNIGLIRAYDNFLANAEGPGGVGLADRYAAMWAHVANFFKDEPGIMGYDLLNEPWPGSRYPACYVTGGDCLDARTNLDKVHDKAAQSITSVDPQAVVFYEPLSIWNQGFNTNPAPPNVEKRGLSWHVYCTSNAIANSYTGCDFPDGLAFNNADNHAAQHNSALLLSEFGATDDPATLNGVLSKAREHLVGWQYWSYCGCDDPTTQNQRQQGIVADPKVPGPVTADAVNQEKLAILAAPHLRATAGTPLSVQWNPETKQFKARWSATLPNGNNARGMITEIAIPKVNFPSGYTVSVQGGNVISEPNADRLLIESTGESETLLTLMPS